MLGLGSSIPRSGKIGPTIIRDGLVLKHDYNAGAVEPASSGAAYFDEGNDDYIAVGDIASLKPGDGSFSISCWVNVKSITETTTRWIVGKADGASVAAGNSEGYGLYLGNGGTLWSFFVSDGAQSAIAVAPNTFIAANQWQHLCATFNGSTLAQIYVDGVLANASSVSAGASLGDIDVSDDFKIGKLTSASTTHNGYICNVGFWKGVVLTQPQVKSIMHKNYAGLSDSEKTNLVSWWNLDSTIPGVSTEVYDNHYAAGSELGSELITNGDFSSDSDWTLVENGESTVDISGGTLNITVGGGDGYVYASQPEASMSAPYVHGSIYVMEATFTRTSGDGGRLRFQDNLADNGGLQDSQTQTELTGNEQSVKFYFKANSNSNTLAIARDNGASGLPVTVKVKSVSLKKVNGNIGTLA